MCANIRRRPVLKVQKIVMHYKSKVIPTFWHGITSESCILYFPGVPPAIFHPNLFAAYRHVGQECCDWFSEVGTRAGQPTKLSRAVGASGHTHRASSTLPLSTTLLLSFVVSSISVRGAFSLGPRLRYEPKWGHRATHTGHLASCPCL